MTYLAHWVARYREIIPVGNGTALLEYHEQTTGNLRYVMGQCSKCHKRPLMMIMPQRGMERVEGHLCERCYIERTRRRKKCVGAERIKKVPMSELMGTLI